MRKKYNAIEVIQQPDAEPFYMISATAEEILDWSDVPRGKEDYLAGYQRSLQDKRTEQISRYLKQSPSNILPGAVIIATDEERVRVSDSGDFKIIEFEEDDRQFEEKLMALFGEYSTNLTEEELASAGINFGQDVDEDATPRSYMALLAKELQEAIQDWSKIPPERQIAIQNFIHGTSKPGLIIDGQHRVFGAKDVNSHDINLPVILMHGLPRKEQVFQFYMLNSKARPLKPTELRRIISTSLTDEEVSDLFDRFEEANVNAEEARWTYEMNTNADSVFRDLIDFGFSNDEYLIKENVADQLVKGFMKMPTSKYQLLINPVRDDWEDDDKRLGIFFDFWRAVRTNYQEEWDTALEYSRKGNQHQLFMKVSLLTLQRWILDRFVTALPYRSKGSAPPLSSTDAISEMVESTLQNLPGAFFTEKWQVPQLDTSEGREFLYGAMSEVWDTQGKNMGNRRLFKKQQNRSN